MVEARLGRGTYTDDTEMMIALADSLVEHGSVDEEQLAQRQTSARGAPPGVRAAARR